MSGSVEKNEYPKATTNPFQTYVYVPYYYNKMMGYGQQAPNIHSMGHQVPVRYYAGMQPAIAIPQTAGVQHSIPIQGMSMQGMPMQPMIPMQGMPMVSPMHSMQNLMPMHSAMSMQSMQMPPEMSMQQPTLHASIPAGTIDYDIQQQTSSQNTPTKYPPPTHYNHHSRSCPRCSQMATSGYMMHSTMPPSNMGMYNYPTTNFHSGTNNCVVSCSSGLKILDDPVRGTMNEYFGGMN